MDPATLIRELGGGLPALVIVALGYAYWTERKDRIAADSTRADREREHAKELMQTILAVQDVSRAVQGDQK